MINQFRLQNIQITNYKKYDSLPLNFGGLKQVIGTDMRCYCSDFNPCPILDKIVLV